MKKLLSPTDWFLLGLGKCLDWMQEIKDPLGLITNYYETIHGAVPDRFKKHDYYHLIWRNLKTGNISKKIENGKVYLELTNRGENRIKRKFPLLFVRNKKWDRKWRLVLFDVAEKKKRTRENLRAKLKELGFAQLQKSVWITPLDFLQDFEEFVEEAQLSHWVILVETEFLFVSDVKEFAQKLWKVEKINNQYENLYLEFIKIKKIEKEKSLKKTGDRTVNLNSLLVSWRQKAIAVYFNDPFLPRELLPDKWWGDKVVRILRQGVG